MGHLTVLDPAAARADELAVAYHERWGTGNRSRPAQDSSPRPREGPAFPAARPGPPGDLRLPDRDLRADRESIRGRRPGPRPHLVRQDPAPDPPLRHRDGGHSP